MGKSTGKEVTVTVTVTVTVRARVGVTQGTGHFKIVTQTVTLTATLKLGITLILSLNHHPTQEDLEITILEETATKMTTLVILGALVVSSRFQSFNPPPPLSGSY